MMADSRCSLNSDFYAFDESMDLTILDPCCGTDSYSVSEDRTHGLLEKLEQSGKVPSKEKFRRMACNTYICCGGCPYSDRCVFLHDSRLEYKYARNRPSKQTKHSIGPKDTFFWPDMRKDHIYQRLDHMGLPDVHQSYQIPSHFCHPMADVHNKAIFSIWGHFVDFCMKSSWENCPKQFYKRDSYDEEDCLCTANKYLPESKRLDVFVTLSCGMNILNCWDFHENFSNGFLFDHEDILGTIDSSYKNGKLASSPSTITDADLFAERSFLDFYFCPY